MGVSRLEVFARLGRVSVAESMFDEAHRRANDAEWRGRLTRAPHGEAWHSSLHVSEFPGDDPRWCPRASLYNLMGHPPQEPASRDLMGTAIVGSAVENWTVDALDLDGRLLSAPTSASRQTGFEDADHWLTGSPDFVVLPKFWNRPHIIETKTKDHDVVLEMKNLRRSYDAAHARQCRAYIGVGSRVAHLAWPKVTVCRETWRLAILSEPSDPPNAIRPPRCRDHGLGADCLIEIELQPLRSGSLIYASRNRPKVTSEYLFTHDEAWFQTGLARLEQVQQYFRDDVLPPQPFGGKEWSALPCGWCRLKRESCKKDHKAGTTKLTESLGNAFADQLYGGYDAAAVHQSVIDRWRGKTGACVKKHDDDSALHMMIERS